MDHDPQDLGATAQYVKRRDKENSETLEWPPTRGARLGLLYLPDNNDTKTKIKNKPMMNQARPNIFKVKFFGMRNAGMMFSSFLQLLGINALYS